MRETKDETAKRLYPGITFDCALPQDWVDQANVLYGFDVRPCFVWGYPTGTIFGKPLPLNNHGREFLAKHYPMYLSN